MNKIFICAVHEYLCFIVGAWFHQQRVLIGLLIPHILIDWIIYFVACSDSVIFPF
jgi:hypothetical protein